MNLIWFICSIPALLFALWAESFMKSTYSKYSAIKTIKNISNKEFCDTVMINENLNIEIENIDGELTDSYDSNSNILRISNANTHDSLSSISVIAHELGHAMQDKENYYFLRFRNFFVPIANIGSQLGYVMVIIGLIVGLTGLTTIGLAFFSCAFVFTVITLPVELDASNRAIKLLTKYNILEENELINARSILNAAALTYVAAIAGALGQLIYLSFISNRRRG